MPKVIRFAFFYIRQFFQLLESFAWRNCSQKKTSLSMSRTSSQGYMYMLAQNYLFLFSSIYDDFFNREENIGIKENVRQMNEFWHISAFDA